VVHPDLRVEVVVPPGTPAAVIEDLYRRKAGWVERSLAHFRDRPCHAPEPRYVSGERFLLLGKELVLDIEHGPERIARFTDKTLEVVLPRDATHDEVRACVVDAYRRSALDVIGGSIHTQASRMGMPAPPFRVKLLRRRWGSCSRTGNLNFNTRLIMASSDLIEYVVVHELCHLQHLDHSPAFWRTVERYLPDYAVRRARLREDGWRYRL
jgi:predicted metal-dependent hydrolase